MSRWVTVLASMSLVASACGGAQPAGRPGPAVEGRAPNVADLWGVWVQVEDPEARGMVLSFNAPGMFSMNDGGEPIAQPLLRGMYSQRAGTIRFTSQGSVECADGKAWTWRAGIPQSGVLHLEHAGGGACGLDAGIRWTLVRVSPSSPASETIPAPAPAGGPAPTVDDLVGMWLALKEDGGGQGILLWLGSDGAFVLDNHGKLFTVPFERGEYELAGRELTFRSGGNDCGDWGWRGSVPQDGVLAVVQTQEGVGNCYTPAGTEWTWMRLSPASDLLAGFSTE
jgi:hypothetical protein